MFLKPKEIINSEDTKTLDNLKGLSLDMIYESSNKAMFIDSINILYTLYTKHLKINPTDPNWLNRDRFVITNSYDFNILYSMLFMSGFDISIEDLRNSYKNNLEIKGVDIPYILEDKVSCGIGIALAESYLTNLYSKDIFDYYTYILFNGKNLLDGSIYEALSLAGSKKLNKLILLYDNNKNYSDNDIDINKYFSSLNLNVITVDNDINSIDNAITKAKQSLLPTVIIINTPNSKYSKYDGSIKITLEDISTLKEELGLRDILFTVSNDAKVDIENMIIERNKDNYDNWNDSFNKLDTCIQNKLNKIKDNDFSLDIKKFDYIYDNNDTLDKSLTQILNLLTDNNDMLLGNNISYKESKHIVSSIMNGLSISGIRSFISTQLSSFNYLKSGIYESCKMNLANIYIFTYNSLDKDNYFNIIEETTSLMMVPNLEVLRPNDINEMVGLFKYVASKSNGTSVIILDENVTKIKENTSINEVKKGAYIVKEEEKDINLIIISQGEELNLTLDIVSLLKEKGYSIRIVSMPSISLFEKEKKSYKEEILPNNIKTLVISNSLVYSWYKYITNINYLITPYTLDGDFTLDNIVNNIEKLLK